MADRWDLTTHRTHLTDAIDELALIWPALTDATERDRGVSTGERVTTSPVLLAPVNADVLDALDILAAGLGRVRDLHRLPHQLDQYRDADDQASAHRLLATVTHCRTIARRAIGLTTPDRPLGEHCPLHDDPLTELVIPGDQGQLCWRSRDPAGQPVGLSVVWRREDVVTCPWRSCGARWTPGQQMRLRGLLRAAEGRRATKQAGDTGAQEAA
ncbi:MAG TPA: hypothetical protein VFM54_05305 [Micromonosporaceae bacterium]|nr:hypothetical protein [Micromonosporaceae bacterium]